MARSSSDNFHPLALWPNGSLVALRMARLDDTTTERTVVAITPRGEISEVLANVSGDPGSVVVAVPGYRASVSIPFVASLPPAASPDGRRLVLPVPGTGDRESATLFVTIVNEAGDTVAARALSFTARPIGSVARDSAIDARLNPRGGRVVGQGVNPASATPRPPGVANRIREELNARVPFVHPAVRSIHVGANYWIWLERQRDSTGSAYDVYDVNLNPLFVVHLSPKSALAHMTATHVWARELDEDDLPSIVRYRIHR